MKLLLLEDDYFLQDGLTELLTKEGYEVTGTRSCQEAREALHGNHFDLLILDVMLPDGSGLDVCREVRAKGGEEPILFLTACDEELQVCQGLDLGADDYVTKPFKTLELLSRVRALLRRRQTPDIQVGGFRIDREHMRVLKNGEALSLTPTEYQILITLMENPGSTVPRGTLLDRIWDCDGSFIDDNTLTDHMSRLREKVGGNHIRTVRGMGYLWEAGT